MDALPGKSRQDMVCATMPTLHTQRYKRIFGNARKTRALPQQKIEAWISASALSRMPNLGILASIKI